VFIILWIKFIPCLSLKGDNSRMYPLDNIIMNSQFPLNYTKKETQKKIAALCNAHKHQRSGSENLQCASHSPLSRLPAFPCNPSEHQCRQGRKLITTTSPLCCLPVCKSLIPAALHTVECFIQNKNSVCVHLKLPFYWIDWFFYLVAVWKLTWNK
jgi:hypothetical protein